MSRPTLPAYQTRNWPAYNEALKRRGSLTIWFDPAMTWEAATTGKRGRQPDDSATAIQTCLTMKVLFGMALRQTTHSGNDLREGIRTVTEKRDRVWTGRSPDRPAPAPGAPARAPGAVAALRRRPDDRGLGHGITRQAADRQPARHPVGAASALAPFVLRQVGRGPVLYAPDRAKGQGACPTGDGRASAIRSSGPARPPLAPQPRSATPGLNPCPQG